MSSKPVEEFDLGPMAAVEGLDQGIPNYLLPGKGLASFDQHSTQAVPNDCGSGSLGHNEVSRWTSSSMMRLPLWTLIAWTLSAATLALFGSIANGATLAATVPQEERVDAPSREEIDKAVAALRAAFAQKDPELRITALNDHRIPAPEVVAFQAQGLRSKDLKIKQAALEALRFTDHEDALRLLHKECKRNSTLRSHEQLGPLLFKAIGQHGDPSSISLLRDNLYADQSREFVRARLFGLANIRHRKALETLIELLRGAKVKIVKRYSRDLRLCLMQLTGVDRGESPDRWREWWSENKRSFELPEKPPLMPLDLQRSWDSYWGIRRARPRGERREDRGGD